MKRQRFGIALVITALWASMCLNAVAAENSKVFSLPYLVRDLPNGLRIVVVKTDYPDVVSLQIPIQTGSRNEVEPGKSGFAHFFEHMMFRGTERFPPDMYEDIIKSVGGDRNAYTSDDVTNYHTTFTKPDLEKMLEVEADRFINLKYNNEQFRTEALAVKGEYLKNSSNPMQKIFETARDLSFTQHSYKHTTMGFLKDIEDMPNQLEYSKVFFDRWYRPNNAAVIVVGDIDPEKTLALVEKYFGPWQRGSYQAAIPVEPAPTAPQHKHIKWEARTQAIMVLAFRGPAFRSTEKEMPAMDILGQVWFGSTSDLYQQLVVKDQLVDQLFYSSPDRKDPSLIMIGARLIKPENASAVRDALTQTLVRARTEAVSDKKLSDIKSAFKYRFAGGLDNSASIAAMLASTVHFERDPETINRQYQSYDALTPADLMMAANRYLVDEGRVLVTLSNQDALPGSAFETPDAINARVKNAANQKGAFAVLEKRGDSPLVSVNLLFATGAAFDSPGKKGLAQLTASMLMEGGTQKRSYRELIEARYPLAAGLGAQVDKEMFSIQGEVHRDNLSKWTELALEQVLLPGFDEEDFRRVKTTLINAIRSDLRGNNDEELAKEVLYQSVYGAAHPYGTLTLGDVSDLEKLTLADVREFYSKQLTQANLTLGVVGGYDPAWLVEFKRSLSQLPAGEQRVVAKASIPKLSGRSAVVIQKETASVAVSFGFPMAVKRGDKDWVALWLARSWLGEHRQSGQLYDRIREVRGMNYGDYAYIEYFPFGMFQFSPDPNLGRQQQLFQVWLRPLRSNSDAVFATRTALFELDKLIKMGMTKVDFEKQRQFLTKFASQIAKNQSAQLGYALDSRYYGIDTFPEYVRRELAKLSLDDVNRAIRKHLQTRDVGFVFVASDAADLTKRLVSSAPSTIEYPTPKPDLAAEDAVIGKWPLHFGADDVRVIAVEQIFE
jgi:zinc protease